MVLDERHRLELIVVDRQEAEAEVEGPASHLVEGGEIGRRLDELDLDVGPLRPEAREDPGNEARRRALKGTDAERPGVAPREALEIGAGPCESRCEPLHVLEEALPGFGEARFGPTRRPLDEPLADDALECGHLLAHRGLRVAQLLRRPCERASARHGLERGEVAKIESRRKISEHDQARQKAFFRESYPHSQS